MPKMQRFKIGVPGPAGKLDETVLENAVRPMVVSELAADPTPANAAAAAVDAEMAGRDLLEGGHVYEDDIAFAVVDEAGRRTWIEAGMDGGLTAHSVSKLTEHISGTVAMDTDVTGLSFAVTDEAGRRTWLEADDEGKPTARALELIGVASSSPVFPVDHWAHWGDSLTAGGWPANMATLTGAGHYNGGWGGQGTNQIAARQGGVPARVTLTGNQIPASGAVTVTSITRSPLSDGGSRTGTIAGVEGTLSRSGTTHTFTRTAAGNAVATSANAYFLPTEAAAYRDRHVTIWTGRNDVMTVTNHVPIVQSIRAMIDYLTPDVTRAIVMSIPPSTLDPAGDIAKINDLNALLKASFPAYYLDIAAWVRTSEAATAAGITFTAGDNEDIAAGFTPRSLRSDELHFNADGNEAIAYRVHQEAQLRGWL